MEIKITETGETRELNLIDPQTGSNQATEVIARYIKVQMTKSAKKNSTGGRSS